MERGDENSSRASRVAMNLRIKIKAHLANQAQQPNQAAETNEGEIELSLGLSMNGRFGVDPSSAKIRKRSCSVSNLPGNAAGAPAPAPAPARARVEARAEHPHEEARVAHAHLPRASSLPAYTKEWWDVVRRQRKERKERKELEAAEARKKRMEKRKSVRVVRVRNRGSGLHGGENGGANVKFPDNIRVSGSGNPMMVQPTNVGLQMGSGSGSARFHVPQAPTMMIGANPFNTRLRSSSSCRIPNDKHGVPRMYGVPSSTRIPNDGQGVPRMHCVPSSTRIPNDEQGVPRMHGVPSSTRIPNDEHGVPKLHGVPSSSNAVGSDRDDRRLLENTMLNMPHVSTMGKGDDRVDGILYKYARADEVKIVCACHGLFFSPAEFILHGGGGDVDQPSKHIFINNY